MIEVKENIKYIITIKNFSFGTVPQEDLIKGFRDGRAFGLISEYILPLISEGKIIKMDGNKCFDHISKKAKIEQRTLTGFGIRLMPSNQIGSGRSYNVGEFEEKVKGVSWFFIIDNTQFPVLETVFIKSNKIDLNHPRYGYDAARKKFFNCKKTICLEI